jgi:hypothetical protein
MAAAFVLAATAIALVSAEARADEESAPAPAPVVRPRTNECFAFGVVTHRIQDDFGVGATVTTLSFARESLRLTLAGGVAWYPHVRTAAGGETWRPYGHMRLVLEAGHRIAASPVRLYGFGGATVMFVPDAISRENVRVGGLGGFGFEFLMPRDGRDGPVSFYIQLGGIGTAGFARGGSTGAPAVTPIMGNGFLIDGGLRFYPAALFAHDPRQKMREASERRRAERAARSR